MAVSVIKCRVRLSNWDRPTTGAWQLAPPSLRVAQTVRSGVQDQDPLRSPHQVLAVLFETLGWQSLSEVTRAEKAAGKIYWESCKEACESRSDSSTVPEWPS